MEAMVDKFFQILDQVSRWGTLVAGVLAMIVILRVLN